MKIKELETELRIEYDKVLNVLGEVGSTDSNLNQLYKQKNTNAQIYILKTIGHENVLRATLGQITKNSSIENLSTFLENEIKTLNTIFTNKNTVEDEFFNIYFHENINEFNTQLKLMQYGQYETYTKIKEKIKK